MNSAAPAEFAAPPAPFPAAFAPMQPTVMTATEIAATLLLHNAFAEFHYSDICKPHEMAAHFLSALERMPGHEALLLGLALQLEREVASLPAAARAEQLFSVELRRADTQGQTEGSASGLTRLIVLPVADDTSPRGTLPPRDAADFCADWAAAGYEALFFTAAPSFITESDRVDRERENTKLTAQEVAQLDRIQGRMLFEAMAASMQSLEAQTMLIGQLKSLRGQIAQFRQRGNSEEKMQEISRNLRGETRALIETLGKGMAQAAALPPGMQQLGAMLRGFQKELRATGIAAERHAPRLTAVRQAAPLNRAALTMVQTQAKHFDQSPIFSRRAAAMPIRNERLAAETRTVASFTSARMSPPQATTQNAGPAATILRATTLQSAPQVEARAVAPASPQTMPPQNAAPAQVSPAGIVESASHPSQAPAAAAPLAFAAPQEAKPVVEEVRKPALFSAPPDKTPDTGAGSLGGGFDTPLKTAFTAAPRGAENPAAGQAAPQAQVPPAEKQKPDAAVAPDKDAAATKTAEAKDGPRERVDRLEAQIQNLIKSDPENYLNNPAYAALAEALAKESEKMPIKQAFDACAGKSCPCGICGPALTQTIKSVAAAITRPFERFMGRAGATPSPSA
ncbi:MAG: hypothetical protein P4M15_12975 [Alphaproteobacteria bacterium]|nr:hypothetical protein [Alphaproteobacteria bacterium]